MKQNQTTEQRKLLQMLLKFTREARKNHPKITTLYVTPKQHRILQTINRSSTGNPLPFDELDGYKIEIAP